MSIATVAPLLPLPGQLWIEAQDAPVVPAITPAALEFALLEAWLASRHALQLPLHQIESQQHTKGREVQRLLLQAHLQHRGDGDVGPALRDQQEAGEVLYTHRRLSTRSLKTIFGTVEIVRMGYSRAGTASLYPLDLVESLFRIRGQTSADGQTPPRPENKRVWASLLKGKTALIAEVAQEMQRRDPQASKTRVALTDGERALQILVERTLGVTLILDLLHVLEKLWKAAYVFHPEGSLQAELWVLDRTLRILFGEVGQVVKGIRQSVTKRRLFGAKRKTLWAVADYLHRNRARMRYDQYLAHGWPIASGPVEGACKNLIKDRMERSGMRWTEEMAEAIVQLRAIYLSGDFDRYWLFHIEKDQQRLHPANWSVVLK